MCNTYRNSIKIPSQKSNRYRTLRSTPTKNAYQLPKPRKLLEHKIIDSLENIDKFQMAIVLPQTP